MKNKLIFAIVILQLFSIITSNNSLKKYMIEFSWGKNLPIKSFKNDSIINLIITNYNDSDTIYIATSVCYSDKLSIGHSVLSTDSIRKILSIKLFPTKIMFLNTFNTNIDGVYHDKERIPSWKHYILISKKQLYEPYEIPRHKKKKRKWWKWW